MKELLPQVSAANSTQQAADERLDHYVIVSLALLSMRRRRVASSSNGEREGEKRTNERIEGLKRKE